MSLISVNNLTFGYDGSYNNIFENVSFNIDTDWKLGLIGKNGVGKSSVLKLLLGENIKYSGEYKVANDERFIEKIATKIVKINVKNSSNRDTLKWCYIIIVDRGNLRLCRQMVVPEWQNKLHYWVHEHTAAELIYDRVDNEKPYVGMTNFKGDYVTIDDGKIAKNYLTEIELQRLNLLVSQFLDFAELQALEQRTMKMTDWIEELDNRILMNWRKVLEGSGKISHEEVIKKAEKEFQIYREMEMKELESDFDLLMKVIPNKKENE